MALVELGEGAVSSRCAEEEAGGRAASAVVIVGIAVADAARRRMDPERTLRPA